MRSPSDRRLWIGELATRADVPVETIRYYERRGVLPEPKRSAAGYREYPSETVQRLQFVRRAQRLGFSLAEIVELLELRGDTSSCGEVLAQIDAKLRSLDARMRDLGRMQSALRRVRAECERADPEGACPSLETLATRGAREK